MLAGVLGLAACAGGKEPPSIPDYGPEAGGKDDSATRPSITQNIGYGQLINFALGAGVNFRAFVFPGNKGQIVDAYAQGLNGTDTVLYLYKISRVTNRPFGKPIGYNDDTEQSGWSLEKGHGDFNEYSSSILGATLPEDRDYALVVTSYQQQGGSAIVKVQPRGSVLPSTIPSFLGTGAAQPIVFTDDTTHATVLSAKQLPVSTELQTALRGAAVQMGLAAFRADPGDLSAAMADPSHISLAYPFLYGGTQASAYDASWTPVTAQSAGAALIQAWGGDEDGSLTPLVTFVLKSMFKESAFRASDVSVFRIHWDNSDDTNADGIVALKASTGEIRVLSLINPP
jgi:hypothetical protein